MAKNDSLKNKIKNNWYVKMLPVTTLGVSAQALGGAPKGAIDKYVEYKLKKQPVTFMKALRQRGLGRFAGHVPYLVTAPLFYKNVKALEQSDDLSKDKKHIAQLMGVGALASGAKGLIEGGIEKGHFDKFALARLLSRTGIGAVGTTAFVYGLSKELKKEKKAKTQKNKILHGYVYPTLLGGVAGGLKGLTDKAMLNKVEKQPLFKDVGPAMGGRVAAGMFGGLLLDRIFKHVLANIKTKKPAKPKPFKQKKLM